MAGIGYGQASAMEQHALHAATPTAVAPYQPARASPIARCVRSGPHCHVSSCAIRHLVDSLGAFHWCGCSHSCGSFCYRHAPVQEGRTVPLGATYYDQAWLRDVDFQALDPVTWDGRVLC